MNTIAEYLSNYHGAEIAGVLSAACFAVAWYLIHRGPRQTSPW